MTAITRIEIRNFQSHRHTVIETAPAGGLTVIVGPSDSGKTAILRALRWLLYNQPDGVDFRRVGCDLVEVSIETADGHTVTRSRTQTTNRYVVDGAKLEGFGRTVPTEVQEITGVFPIRLGDQEILANLAGQLEAPFLGSSISGPARAKALGKLAGIEVIDRAMRDLAGDVQRTRLEKSRLEAELERLDGEIARYSHLPALAARIEQLRTISARIEAAYERWKALSEVQQQVQALNAQIEDAEHRLTAIGDVDGATKALDRARAAVDRRDRLTEIGRELTQAKTSLEAAETTLARLKNVDWAASFASAAESAIMRLRTVTGIREELTAANQQLEGAEKRIQQADRILAADEPLRAVTTNVERLSALVELKAAFEAYDSEETEAEEQVRRCERILNAGTHLDEIAARIERRGVLAQLYSAFISHQNAEIMAERRIDAASVVIEETTREYTAALAASGTCPTCGQTIDDSIHAHIQEVLVS